MHRMMDSCSNTALQLTESCVDTVSELGLLPRKQTVAGGATAREAIKTRLRDCGGYGSICDGAAGLSAAEEASPRLSGP